MYEESEEPGRQPPPSSGAVATDTWEEGRQFAIYTGNILLGTSNLEYPITIGSRIAGRFLPTSACDNLTWVFQLYSSAAGVADRPSLKAYVRERDRLRLELWCAGSRLNAIVELISTWPDGTHIVHVASTDPQLWRPRNQPD